MKSLRFYVFLTLAFSVSACSRTPRPNPLASANAPRIQSATAGDLPAPSLIDQRGASERRFVIGPLDRLIIDVFGIEEMRQREVQADASGRILFPLIGEVQVAGKTPGEVAAFIRSRLRGEYIRDPQVTVNLRETVSQIFTVDGEVRDPGSYPMVGRMSLLKAVAAAKGTTESARQSRVLVFRTVNGQRLAGLYDLRAIRQGVYGDPEIYVNDIIVVGDDPARRLLATALGVIPVVTTPLILLLR